MTRLQHQHHPEPADVSDSDYDRDLVAWAMENATLLRVGRLDRIDAAHIAEELEDLGKSERRALGSHLRNLVLHLLKWEFQPGRRTGNWRSSIDNARVEIAEILEDSPSLGAAASERLEKGYALARKNAISETGLASEVFPQRCPYSLEQVLSDNFWPGPRG
ncbi:MAG: DUF29 domain-containing protein [Candidatus Thiosymbion ectosymbiont of Robbea hypermnestra]|nr:DUF29 domain-containing protein [Candidatus Thiosymbion ectosymbiont of Robbea hypermnestra]